jgi:hypothetical protein
MHLITRHAKLHTQIVSFLFPNDVDFIPNNYVYKKKHLCIGTICLSKSEKMRLWRMTPHYQTQRKKWIGEVFWHKGVLESIDKHKKNLQMEGL